MSTPDRAPWLPDRWSTRVGVRTVLAVVHNVTAATRLFDILPLIAGDDRIHVVFTQPGSSAFDEGTASYLAARGVRQLPWPAAVAGDFDLAVAASYGGDLHLLRCPRFVVPHGMGYNKFLGKSKIENRKSKIENRKSVFGLSVDWLMHDGHVIPTVLVLSHDEQLARLRRDCPDAVDRALVAGDIVHDQLVASRPLRPTYRRALGVSRDQRLVVVSSTWGQESLLGTHPQLAQRLAETLPADEFRIAVALHPNVWFGHSQWQVSQWFASCRDMGVTVLHDMDEWRAAVVAADLLVGDHGSVPFYSTAVGNPLLLATAPGHTVAPDSPIAALLSTAPRLNPTADLEAQIRQAIANHNPERYAEITALTTSVPGKAATLLRSAMYTLLALPEPDTVAEAEPLPLPSSPLGQAGAHLVQVTLDADHTASIRRYPAERRRAPSAPAGHLVADVTSARHRWLELADVVTGPAGPDTETWMTDTLARLPGCAVATAPTQTGTWLLTTRSGPTLQVEGPPTACHLFASVAYETPTPTGTWTIRTGPTTHQVTVTRTP